MPTGGAGGKVVFPAPRDGEFDIRKHLPDSASVPADRVFSGEGLVTLYHGLATGKGLEPGKLTAPQITKAGLAGEDVIAAEAVDLMAIWFARFAGDVALLTGARGGVYLAGALAANIVPAIGASRFRAAFEDKSGAAAYLHALPVKVIKMGADAGLRGAAIALARELPSSLIPARKILSQPT
jgi:glucokinase